MPADERNELERIFREESGRVVAHLVRLFGDIDIAEEAAQEAFVVASERWAADGLPPNPGGWLTTTARNRAIDRLRRERRATTVMPKLHSSTTKTKNELP